MASVDSLVSSLLSRRLEAWPPTTERWATPDWKIGVELFDEDQLFSTTLLECATIKYDLSFIAHGWIRF